MNPTTTAYLRMARFAKRRPVWWVVLLAVIGALIGGMALGSLLLGLIFNNIFLTAEARVSAASTSHNIFSLLTSGAQGLFLIMTTIFSILFAFAWLIFYERRPIASLGFQNIKTGPKQLLLGSLFGITAVTANVAILVYIGEAELSEPTLPSTWALMWPLLILLLGWLVQGSSEEILTRGLLLQAIGGRYGLVFGIAVSALFFTISHGINPNTTPLFFVNLMLFSLLAAAYVIKERGLWGICGFHGMWNFAQGNLFGITVSGQRAGSESVFQTSLSGNPWVSGGTTGLEGGTICTAILLLCCPLIFTLKVLPAYSRK